MTLPTLRTIYNGPARGAQQPLRADELRVTDLVFQRIYGAALYGVVAAVTPVDERVRLRLVDPVDHTSRGEFTFAADQIFYARRITTNNEERS